MKKTLLIMMAILAMNITAMAQNVADIIGTYKGDLYIQLLIPIDEETEVMHDQFIKLDAGEGQSINFALNNFAFAGMKLGDIILKNVGISKEGNSIKFDDEAPTTLKFVTDAGTIDATAKINAQTSYIKDNKIIVNLDVQWIQGANSNVPIYVRFIGDLDASAGIEGVEKDEEKNNGIYTLNGTRVNNSLGKLPKGIYIINGKKIIK